MRWRAPHPSSLLSVLVAAGLTLACAGLETVTDALPEGAVPHAGAALPAPWPEMNLPLRDGELVSATAQSLSVTYTDGQAAQRAREWADALSDAGFEVTYSTPDGVLYQLRGASGEITVAATQAGNTVLLAVSAIP